MREWFAFHEATPAAELARKDQDRGSELLARSEPAKEEDLDRVRILFADDHKEFLAAAARLLQPTRSACDATSFYLSND